MRAWIITKDYITDKNDPTDRNDVGTCGPRNAPEKMIADLKKNKGYAFVMKDGDRNIYYRGRAIWDEEEFDSGPYGPLGDFGLPNAGCVEINYLNHPEFDCS